MVFNHFWIEAIGESRIIRFAYVQQGVAPHIVPVYISQEGLKSLRESAKTYIANFVDVPPYKSIEMPVAKQFSPLFANIVRLAHSGDAAELCFYTVTLSDIAQVAMGVAKASDKTAAIPTALMHSGLLIHQQVVIELLST